MQRRLFVATASILALSLSSAADAGVFRAYLSTAGNDANPCTLPQPCRLLPAALAVVNNGGEIWILDSANYNTGTVNIAKSVTILAVPGTLGSVIGNNGDAIAVRTPNVMVTLRNLNVVHLAGSGNGISVTAAGAEVVVEKCEIYGLEHGIVVTAPSQLSVVETTIRENGRGIFLDNGATATVSHSHLINNLYVGLLASPSIDTVVTATVNDTEAIGSNYGFLAEGASATRYGRIFVTRSVASNNHSGFRVGGGYGEMTVGDSMATTNFYGFGNDGGKLYTTGTNLVFGNESNSSGALTPLAPM